MDLLPSEQGQRWPQARQHWIVLLSKRPARHWTIVSAVFAFAALAKPMPMLWVFLLVVAGLGVQRYRLWHSEKIVLTNRRIIHVHGVLVTTRTEAWLRLDRILGMRISETWLGNRLGYASIAVEAPGDHPGLTRLWRIAKAQEFYRRVRNTSLDEHDPELDEHPGDYITEKLPELGAEGRFRRR